jgi:probable F420-dependent oxidoreductase
VVEGVAITLPVEDGLPALEYVELARLAERCGYHAVLAGEVSGPEVFGLLGLIAGATSAIGIGSGIVGCYARPPALTAMGFATLASAAPGRVIAGLGASSPVIVRDWFGGSFASPLVAVEEFVAVLREALSGSRVSHAGQVFASEGFRLTTASPSPPVPVLLAAMNPAMLRLAGRIADGVFITWTPPGEVAGRLGFVRDGEAAAGRPAGSVWAAASFWAYCGPRVAEALERLRRVVLQYAMVPTHRESFRAVFPALDPAAALWERGDRMGALRLVGDETVHALCAVGSPARVASHVRALQEAGVTLPVVLTPGAESGDAEGARATIAGLASELGLAPREGSLSAR